MWFKRLFYLSYKVLFSLLDLKIFGVKKAIVDGSNSATVNSNIFFASLRACEWVINVLEVKL